MTINVHCFCIKIYFAMCTPLYHSVTVSDVVNLANFQCTMSCPRYGS